MKKSPSFLNSHLAIATAVSAALFSTLPAWAGTENDVINGQTDLTLAGTYSGGLPTAASDVTFTNIAYSPAAFTLGSALTIGTLNDLSATALTISGAGPLTLSGGTNSVAPNAADLLYVATGGSLTISNTPIILTTAAAAGNFDVAGTASLGGVISGTGFGFTKTGVGTLTLSGANLFSGGVNINAGTVSSTNAAGFGTGAVAIGGSGTASLNFNANIGNVFTGTGNLTTTGAGNNVTFTSATALNGFTGTLNLNTTGNGKTNLTTAGQTIGSGATVNIGANATLFAQNTAAFSGVTFNLNGTGNGELLGALRLEGATIAANSTVNLLANSAFGGNTIASTIAAPITGTGFGFNKVGSNIITLSGTNTYTGAVTIFGGVLQFNSPGAIGGTGANVTVNANTAAAAGYAIDQSFLSRIVTTSAGSIALGANSANNLDFSAFPSASLGADGAFTYSGTLTPNGTTYRLGGGGGALTVSSALTGAGNSLVATGSTVSLTGNNTYAGTTTVNNGATLQFAGTGSSASSAGVNLLNANTIFNATGNGTATSTRLANLTLGGAANVNPANGLIVSNTGNTTATTDAITGNITLNASAAGTSGISNVIFTPSTLAGASETLTANGLTQQAGAILNVTTSGTLGTNSIFRLTNAPTQLGANGTAAAFTQSVVPYAYNAGGGVLTYDATSGFVKAATTGTAPTAGGSTLINYSGGGFTLAGGLNTTINSLNLAGTVAGDTGSTLTVNSGVVYVGGTSTISVPTLALGTAAGYFGNAGRAATISSVITGSSGVTFFDNQGGGVGVTALTAANTYTGVTNVDAGGAGFQLVLANTNALQNSTLNLTSGSIAIGNAANNVTALNLGGLSGSVNINLTNGFTPAASVALTVSSDNDSTTYSGVLGNGTVAGGSVTKVGTGTLTLTGANSYSGGTTITGGAISAATDTFVGTGGITLNGGTLNFTNATALTATRIITVGAAGGAISETGAATTVQNSRVISNTVNGLIGSGALTLSGNGTLGGTLGTTNTGAGVLVLNRANTYSGNVTMQNGGLLEYGAATAVAGAATFTLGNEGEVAVNSGLTAPNAVTVSGGTNSVLSFENGNAGVYSGPITANATLTVGLRDWYNYATPRSGSITGLISGAGGLTTTGGGTLTLTQAEAYTGPTTIGTGSTLKTSNSNNVLATSSAVSIASGATLDVNGNGVEAVNNLSGAGTVTSSFSQNNSGVSLVNTTNTTFSGVINNLNGPGVVKSGAGTLTLSGANTYTGATVIGAGALLANNTTGSATGTGSVTVNSTGTLGGAGFVVLGTGNNVTVNGTLSPGNSPGILSVTGTQTAAPVVATDATLNLASGSTFRLELNNAVAGTGYDQISLVGTASIGGSLLSISLGNGFNPTSTTFVVILNDGTTDLALGNFANSGTVQATNDLGTYAFTSSTVGGDGNDVVLTAALVPEPSTWSAMIGGLGLLALIQSSRRKRI